MPSQCETFEERLPDLLDGSLDEFSRAAATSHAASCSLCSGRLAELASFRHTIAAAHATPPLGGGFTSDVMRRVRRAAPAPRPRLRIGRAAIIVGLAAAVALVAAIAFIDFEKRDGDTAGFLRTTRGATLVVGADAVRVGRPGDRIVSGDVLISLPGDSARLDLGDERSIALAPLSVLRVDSGDAVSLRIGELAVSALDPNAKALRVGTSGGESVMISGAEGTLSVDGSWPPGDSFQLWTVSSPLADNSIRHQIARVEIASLNGEFRLTRPPARDATRLDVAPTLSDSVVTIPAGQSYRRRFGPSAPADSFAGLSTIPALSTLLLGSERFAAQAAPLAPALAGADDSSAVLHALERALSSPVKERAADAALALAFVAPVEAGPWLARAVRVEGVDADAAESGSDGEALFRFALADALSRLPDGAGAEPLAALAAAAHERLRAAGDDVLGTLASTPADLSDPSNAATDLLRALEAEGSSNDAALLAIATPASEPNEPSRVDSHLRRYVIRAELRSAAMLGGDDFVPWIGSLLVDRTEDREIRMEAALALGRIASRSGTDYLLEVIAADDDALVIGRSIFALAGYRDPAAAPALQRILENPDRPLSERRLAAVALRRSPGDAASAAALVAVAEDPASDESLVAEALYSLGERREPAALRLVAAALSDPRERIREAALDAATTQPDASLVPALESRLDSEADPLVRRDVVRALGAVSDSAAASAIWRATEDADRDVRLEAYAAAAHLPALQGDVERRLIDALAGEAEEKGGEDLAMTETLIGALGTRAASAPDGDAIVQALAPFLGATEPAAGGARLAAAAAIGRVRSGLASGALTPLLDDADPAVAAAAAEGLLRNDDRAALARSIALASTSADPAVRLRALAAIVLGVRPDGPLAADAFRFAIERLDLDAPAPSDEAFLALLVADRLAGAADDADVRARAEARSGSTNPWVAWAALTALAARSDDDRLARFVESSRAPIAIASHSRDGNAATLPGPALVGASRSALATRPLFSDADAALGAAAASRRVELETLNGRLAAYRARMNRLETAMRERLVSDESESGRARAAGVLAEFPSADVARELLLAAGGDPSASVRAAATGALRHIAAAAGIDLSGRSDPSRDAAAAADFRAAIAPLLRSTSEHESAVAWRDAARRLQTRLQVESTTSVPSFEKASTSPAVGPRNK